MAHPIFSYMFLKAFFLKIPHLFEFIICMFVWRFVSNVENYITPKIFKSLFVTDSGWGQLRYKILTSFRIDWYWNQLTFYCNFYYYWIAWMKNIRLFSSGTDISIFSNISCVLVLFIFRSGVIPTSPLYGVCFRHLRRLNLIRSCEHFPECAVSTLLSPQSVEFTSRKFP